jgi:hypothetical protein
MSLWKKKIVQDVSYVTYKIPIFIYNLKKKIYIYIYITKEKEVNVQNINSTLSDLRYIFKNSEVTVIIK